MTIGTGSFIPGGDFAVPRPYLYTVQVGRYGDTVTHVDGRFTVHAVPPDPTTLTIQFSPVFWTWQSGVWQLSEIITECFALIGGVGAEVPINYLLTWNNNPAFGQASLYVYWFGATTDLEIVTLPPSPPDYWLNKPMGR